MTQRIINLILSIVASAAGFLLSWPFQRDFEYWGESPVAWWLYFITGFVLTAYVFYVFIGCLRTLFVHDSLMKSQQNYPEVAAGGGENGGAQ